MSFARAHNKWRATVLVAVAGGQTKQTSLGYSVSEERAAERVSAGAYVLGDRCARTRVSADACTWEASAVKMATPTYGSAGARPGWLWAASAAWRRREVRHVAHADGGLMPLRGCAHCTLYLHCWRAERAGRALAVEVLGQAKVAQLEELVRGPQVRSQGRPSRRPLQPGRDST